MFTNAIRILTLFAAASVLFGCAAPSQKLSAEDRKQLTAVRISQDVALPAEPFMLTPGSSGGMLFGAVGAAAANGSITDSRKAFVAFLDTNSISMKRIAAEEIERALRASGKYKIVAADDISAPVIHITVRQYGFGVNYLLSSKVVPVMDIKCEMVDNTGKVIWRAGERIGPSVANPVPSTTWADLSNDPKMVESQLRKAAQYNAAHIVGEL